MAAPRIADVFSMTSADGVPSILDTILYRAFFRTLPNLFFVRFAIAYRLAFAFETHFLQRLSKRAPFEWNISMLKLFWQIEHGFILPDS